MLQPVIDQPDRHRFVVQEDGGEAELVYRLNGKRLVLVHTGTPPELRRRGLAGRLVRAAVERAAAEALTVVPACPFARTWLEDHPAEADSVSVDWEEGALT